MFPSFVKRISSSFSFGKNSNEKGDNSKPVQESSSRGETGGEEKEEEEIKVLRRQDTHELAHEGETVTKRSSRAQAIESVKQATKQLSRKTSRYSSTRSIKETTKNELRRKTVERIVTRPSSNTSSRDGDTSVLSRSSLSRKKTGSLSKKTSSASNERGSVQARSLSKSKNSVSSTRGRVEPELSQSSLSRNKTGSLSKETPSGSSEHGSVQKRNLSESKKSVSRTREMEALKLSRPSLSRKRTRSLKKKTSSVSSEHGSSIQNSDLSETRKSVSSVREREASELSRSSPSRKRTIPKKTSSVRSENGSALQTSDLSKSTSLLSSAGTGEASEPSRSSLSKKRTISLTKKTSSVTSENGGTIKSQLRKSLSITRARQASEPSRSMLSRNKTGSLSKKSSSVSSENGSLKKRNLLELRKSLSGTRKNLTQSSSNHQGSSDTSTPATSKKKKNQKELWFPRGAFLAVKADDDDDAFYLCRSLYNVYSFTKQVPVRWLYNKKLPMTVNVYHLGYQDTIEIYSILMQVDIVQLSHTRFFLPFDVLNEINRLLKLSADVEEGNMSLAELEDDVEPIILSDEPPAKKPRLKKTASQKLRDKEAKLIQKKQKSQAAGGKKTDASKSKGESQSKRRKVTKSQSELELHPRPDIKILEKDPLFETREDIPYISKVANASLIYRAINLQDNGLLKELLTDGNTIYRLYTKSVDTDDSPLTEALKCKDTDILHTVMEEYFGKSFKSRQENNNQEPNMLDKLDTGRYNDRCLGIPFIRTIAASRGYREGNNAFLKKEKMVYESEVGEALVHASISEAQYNVMVSHFEDEADFITQVFDETHIPALLLSGKNEIVGKIVQHKLLNQEEYFRRISRRKSYNRYFTQIYRDVVLFKDEELKNCSPSVVGQVSKSLLKLSPFHFAATNPNSKYLKQLLSVQPDVHITDKSGRSPIHFAAGCSSTSTLSLLLDWGANPNQTDSSRRIPLHYAVEANRPDNVLLLLEYGKKKTDDVLASKFGVGGVNKRTSSSSTPLHIAAERRLFEVCKILLEFEADVNAKLSIAENSETPLMKAAAAGDLKIVRLLVEHGAVVEQKDRMGRTAVIHSCMNGSTSVLSYLLNIGANGEMADNSGNTPLHYAAAYGWFFTVRLLLEAGANPNISNMWKMTPIAVAYFKGHPGIVRELLNRGGADINSPNDYGMTMIFHACSSDLRQTDLCEQIRYMVEEKGALCTLKDHNKRTPLHHLADTTLPDYYPKEAYEQTVAIADLLVRNGCELNAVDDKGSTAVMLVLAKMKNYPLAEFLIKKGCHILMPSDGNQTTTILHEMAKNIWLDPLSVHTVLDLFKIHKHMDTVKSMANHVDHNGYTPLLLAVKEIQKEHVYDYDDVTQRKQQRDKWEAARKFITILIRDLEADINAKVEKKFFASDGEEPPYYWWDDSSIAHRAAVHLALTGNDPAFDESGVITAKFSGELFRSFVNLGANVNVYDNSGHTPLATCIDYKYTELMDFLFNNSDCDFNIATNNGTSKLSPLIYAVKRNIGADILNKLIDLGCDINCVWSDQNKTFLQELISTSDNSIRKEDKLKVIEKLAEKKYDFNITDLSKNTALHFAVCGNSGAVSSSYELEVRLLQLGADAGLTTWEGKTALHYVFYKGPRHPVNTDPAELTKLICRNMTKEQIDTKDKYGKTALHYASMCGATTCCTYLLMIGAEVNIQDNDGNTPLAFAILHGHQGCATLFIQNGANLKVQLVEKPETPTAAPASKPVKQKVVENKSHSNEESESSDSGLSDDDMDDDNDKITGEWIWQAFSQEKKADETKISSLYQAAIERNLSGVAMFITDAGCDRSGLTEFDAVSIAIKTYKYKVALHLICTTTDLSVLCQTGDNKQNLLHILALSCEHVQNNQDDALIKVGEALVKAGVPVNAGDEWNCTPLLYAVINRHSALAGILLERIHHYDENYQDRFKRTYLAALFWRCHSRKMEKSSIMGFILKLLGHIRVNAAIYLPLNPELASIEHQEKNCDPDIWQSYPESKTSALILSVIYGDLWLTRTILEQAVDPNIPDGNKITPLMHAVIQNKADYVRVLLNYSYDPDQEAEKKAEQSKQQAVAASQSWNLAGMFHFTNTGGSISTASTEANRMALRDSVVSDKTKDQQNKENKDEEFTIVQKTSPVNLNAKDSNGRTVLHYVAKPLPTGTYDNAEIAYVLAKAGARMMKDSAGVNPYELAVMSGASKVAAVFRKHYKLTDKDKKHPLDRDFPVDDRLSDELMDLPDYKTAAECVLREYDTGMEADDTYCHKVNENCSVVNGELMMDEEQGICYDALMTIVDVKQGDWGLYNFYQMQLIHQPSKNLYILFTRWGRIHDKGQFQHTPFFEKAEAVKHFTKLFRQKTGNAWANIKSFEKKPGRYRLVEDAARKPPTPQSDIHFKLHSKCKSHLPRHLYKVIKTLMDPKVMQLSMNNSWGISTESLPFGQLHKERLMQGMQILEQIEKLLNEAKTLRAKRNKEEIIAFQNILEKISELSNDYFHVVPQKEYVYEKIRPLDKRDHLQHQINMVKNLLDYEIVCKMLLAAMYHRKQLHPVDYVYRCLDCKMELMSQDDTMTQMILKYIWTGTHRHVKARVSGIYKLAREGESDRLLATGLENRCLLWHGSNKTNLLSIFSRGLVVSPPEAKTTGSLYGQGIYFSDSFYKCSNYQRDSDMHFMLLCEVALGDIKYHEDNEQVSDKDGYNSLVVLGNESYGPTSWLILPSGVSIPQGMMQNIRERRSHYSEYVVKDPAQVCLRYLVLYNR